VTVQTPSGAQQAPVGAGCGQALGEQSVPAPVHVLEGEQPASVVTPQAPSDAQQAPVAGG